jgi:TorA maturation chaperone TorD
LTSSAKIDRVHLRRSIYAVLASAFSPPQGDVEKLYEAILEANETLGQSRSDASKGTSSELSKEYLRLFVGPGHVLCPPYESVVRKDRPKIERGTVMGPSVADVRRRYSAAGLGLSKTFTDLPDHISAEMEFMHFLCNEESRLKEQGKDQEAKNHRELQRSFFNDHLQPWIPDFASCTLTSTKSSFYQAAANLLTAFANSELEYFREEANE